MKKSILLTSVILLLAACAKPSTQSPYLDRAAIDQETAYQRGQTGAPATKLDAPVTMDELQAMKSRLGAHASRVREAGQNLCRNMGRDPATCIYSFEVKIDKNLNAYADGSKIYVTPAMMRFASDDDTLGMVLSHEYAHNMMGHIDSQKTNAMAGMAIGTLADMLASSQGYSTGGNLGQLGANTGIRVFSPDFEQEADYVGMYIMALAGYDIDRAADLWRRMTQADPEGAFMGGTHPTNPHRYVLLTQTKNEIVDKVRRNVLLAPNLAPKR